MITLGFHGAARTVTGSKYLLTSGTDQLLVDCGQFQGLKHLRLKNWEAPPFKASGLKWVALTHTHIDHCGYLPRLVKEGFQGPVFCTPPTVDLLKIVLMDAAKLQMEDADRHNRMGTSAHKPALPLFDKDDVERTLTLVQAVEYGTQRKLSDKLSIRFIDVGHILGSAMIQATAVDEGKTRRILFSGDVGRYNMPLPPDPSAPPDSDYLVVESTYGNRKHDIADPKEELFRVVEKVVKNKGILLVPAFAVGRSQQILFMLRELANAKRIPLLPVHLDSPMAHATTQVYLKYMSNSKINMDALKGGGSIIGQNVTLHKTAQDSRRLEGLKGPAVVIASSGMLAGGRILNHLRNFMPLPTTVLAIAGYQAEGTRGRALLEGKKVIRVYGEEVQIRGEVVDLDGFSGHADCDELMRWTGGLSKAPVKVFVTHGEEPQAVAFAERLKKERGWDAAVPAMNEVATL